MSLKIYILSPHIDDAAFCLALHISQFVECKIPVTLINCFTISTFTTIDCGVKSREQVSALRKKEDVAFNNLVNSALNIINLDLLDAPLRNRYIHQFNAFDTTELNLIKEIKTFLKENTNGILFCPLALGNHIDHTICLEAVTQLYPSKQVLFYEDLPYAGRVGPDEIDTLIKNLEQKLGVQLESQIGGLQDCKIDKKQAIKVYKSQVNDEICFEIISYMQKLSGERLWGRMEELNILKLGLNHN